MFDEPDDDDAQSVSSANPYADSYATARPVALAARTLPVLAEQAPPRDFPAAPAGEEAAPSVSVQPACAADDPYENAVLIGELFGTYIVLENGPEMILIDKHAAHERLLYNRLVAAGPGEDRQLLLTPVSVHLSPEEHAAVLEWGSRTLAMGLSSCARRPPCWLTPTSQRLLLSARRNCCSQTSA